MKPKDLGPFQEEEIAVMAKQIVSGLEYIHSYSIIHRDLKCIFFFKKKKSL